jgi:glycosyltransferase involved in cell wall biosynthesis
MTSFRDRLAELGAAQDLVDALRLAARLAEAAATADPSETLAALTGLLDSDDDISALAAIEALARVPDDHADRVLAELLDDPRPAVREHAIWRLAGRFPARHTYGRLVGVVVSGGFTGMLAQATLVDWARIDPAAVTAVIDGALAIAGDPDHRARLVETLGAIDDPAASTILSRIALDPDEAEHVRIAAIGGIGDRTNMDNALQELAGEPGDLGAHAALALDDRTEAQPLEHDLPGLHLAQLTLVGDLDGQLSRGGTGDTGGVASLLVSASGALARHPDVAHVLTIGRGTITDVVAAELAPDDDRQGYAAVCIGTAGRRVTDLADAWEHRLSIERGIRRVLRHRWRLDVLHLRMADVGTLAASKVAAEFGVPVAFSLAPDPHGVVRSLQAQGRVDRRSFGEVDQQLHVWFRARLVEQLARDAAAIALFPRLEPGRVLADVGLDPDEIGDRMHVVAEGVDVDALRQAEARVASGRAPVVDEIVARLGPERGGRPLLVSAGRLHPVKGMDRVVAAWARDPELRSTTNLVMIGGDLHDPSPTEREVLDMLAAELGADPRRVDGLVLLGGRPRRHVHEVLAAARGGWGEAIVPGGVYVNGALKEEFGLALVEALGIGLPVVAPSVGGPATFVVDGDTGILVDPEHELTDGIRAARRLVDRDGREHRARRLVTERYSIDAMADALVRLYRPDPVLS